MAINNYLLCCDWGTSSFRLRLVKVADFTVLAEHHSAEGVAGTFRAWQAAGSTDRFEYYSSKLKTALGQLAKTTSTDLSNIPMIVSGMASSSIGMEEIPYAPLPFSLDGSGVASKIFPGFNGPTCPLILVSGVKSDDDVMRGEEAQVIGIYGLGESAIIDKNEALFIFPGTHSKHMSVKNRQIVDFRTYMTGEIFNIISEQSILKDSTTMGGELKDEANRLAFSDGVRTSASSTLLHNLFTVRTKQLFSRYSKEENSFYLSGLLIGDELGQIRREAHQHLVVCSGSNLFEQYKLAADVLNLRENITFIQPDLIDKATIAGQVQIFNALNSTYE